MEQFISFAATKENTPTAHDAVSVFYSKMDRQVALAEQAKVGEKIGARVLWLKRDGSGYRVRIGREALKFGDHRWVVAATLD